MVDVVDSSTRSRMMAGIRGKNTGPEFAIRGEMFRRGFRYRLHDRRFPGTPDLVFARHRAVLMVHGCFWHGHDCRYFKLPVTRRDFWAAKIRANQRRDAKQLEDIGAMGWRVGVVWECALRRSSGIRIDQVGNRLERWLRGKRRRIEIRG